MQEQNPGSTDAERGTEAHELAERLAAEDRRQIVVMNGRRNGKSIVRNFLASTLTMAGASAQALIPNLSPAPTLGKPNYGPNPMKVRAKPGPGYRAVKRAAAKRRNVLRNKRAHRGGR